MNKNEVIRCKNKFGEKICNNPICVKKENEIVIKRHGRECHISLTDGIYLTIICERCGQQTRIKEAKTK